MSVFVSELEANEILEFLKTTPSIKGKTKTDLKRGLGLYIHRLRSTDTGHYRMPDFSRKEGYSEVLTAVWIQTPRSTARRYRTGFPRVHRIYFSVFSQG